MYFQISAVAVDLNPLPSSMSKENELGTLIIVILKAKDLNDKHSFYKSVQFSPQSQSPADLA